MSSPFLSPELLATLDDFYTERATIIDPNAGASYSSTGQRKAATGAPVSGLENLPCEIAPLKGDEMVANRPSSMSLNPSSQTLVISTHKVAFQGLHEAITSLLVFSVASGPYTGKYEITRVDSTGLQTVIEISKVK